jgi:cytochrome c oxidase subunit IV
MSTATDSPHLDGPSAAGNGDGHGDTGYDHAHRADSYYVKIAVILAAITGLEVSLKYVDIGALFLPVLFVLMAVKFVMVVLFFMHLRFDSKWFNMAFWSGLGLAILVYVAALTTFKFWSK